METLS